MHPLSRASLYSRDSSKSLTEYVENLEAELDDLEHEIKIDSANIRLKKDKVRLLQESINADTLKLDNKIADKAEKVKFMNKAFNEVQKLTRRLEEIETELDMLAEDPGNEDKMSLLREERLEINNRL